MRTVGDATTGRRRIVIGIPTRDEAATIETVVAAADQGLRESGLAREAVLVNADSASADGTARRFTKARGSVERIVLTTDRAASAGKGTNVLAILSAAADLGAERVFLIDGDVRSIQPWWVTRMLAAVDVAEPAMALPIYRRNRYEGNTTHHIVSPLLEAVLGVSVQQPIAGDVALNAAFVKQVLSWPVPESAQLYGIDVHLSANAARVGLRIVEVPLDRKLHNPGFPKILPMSQQVIDSLFHALTRPLSRAHIGPGASPRATVDLTATKPDADLVARTTAKVARYLRNREADVRRLFPALGDAPRRPWGFAIDERLWAELLADALDAVARGMAARARDHLVALYVSRVMTYWEQIEDLGRPEEIDALLGRQNALVVDAVTSRGTYVEAVRLSPEFEPGYWSVGAV